MNIEITPKKSEGLERLLQVSVPAADVRDAENQAARRYASRVRLPGFRPGKAPAEMIRKRFADVIRQEAIESLVQEAFKEVVEREQLKLAGQPHVHDVHFDEGQPLTFELHVEVRPELTLARTNGFRVSRKVRIVTDEQVREQLDEMREQRATWTPTSERPRPGDMVTVQLATADESEQIPEGREYRLLLGAGQAIPGIEEVITETDPGQTTERPVRWPDDSPDEEQRGKTKSVRVTLIDVKRKALPELDDAFAREVGDFDSLDALTRAVRDDLARMAERETDAEVRQALIDEIISANPFDVPQSWVTQFARAHAQAYLAQAYGEASKVPEEELERFAQEFRPIAERLVRRELVIDTIADREGLAATEADIDERVAEVAKARGAEPGPLYASLQKSGRLRELERGITDEKVFAWLRERNTIE